MNWRKILSQHDMRNTEAYLHGYGEMRSRRSGITDGQKITSDHPDQLRFSGLRRCQIHQPVDEPNGSHTHEHRPH
jgi:hypothetical protein